jgi:hypothetical protein
MKVDLDLVKLTLQRRELDVRTVNAVIQDIVTEVKLHAEEAPKNLPVKKQFVILVSDPKGELMGKDFTGWVLQIPEEDSPYVVEERLRRGGCNFNVTRNGRRFPVRTIAEVCEVVSTRILKEFNLWVKTRDPVLVVTTKNKLTKGGGE